MTKNKYQEKKTTKNKQTFTYTRYKHASEYSTWNQRWINVDSTFFQRCMPDGIPADGSQWIISNHRVLKDFNGLIRHSIRPYTGMCFLVFPCAFQYFGCLPVFWCFPIFIWTGISLLSLLLFLRDSHFCFSSIPVILYSQFQNSNC